MYLALSCLKKRLRGKITRWAELLLWMWEERVQPPILMVLAPELTENTLHFYEWLMYMLLIFFVEHLSLACFHYSAFAFSLAQSFSRFYKGKNVLNRKETTLFLSLIFVRGWKWWRWWWRIEITHSSACGLLLTLLGFPAVYREPCSPGSWSGEAMCKAAPLPCSFSELDELCCEVKNMHLVCVVPGTLPKGLKVRG